MLIAKANGGLYRQEPVVSLTMKKADGVQLNFVCLFVCMHWQKPPGITV